MSGHVRVTKVALTRHWAKSTLPPGLRPKAPGVSLPTPSRSPPGWMAGIGAWGVRILMVGEQDEDLEMGRYGAASRVTSMPESRALAVPERWGGGTVVAWKQRIRPRAWLPNAA